MRVARGSSPNSSSSTPGSSMKADISTSSSNTQRRPQTTSASRSLRSIGDQNPRQLTILPTLWFRNTWSWGQEGMTKPQMQLHREKSVRVVPWGLPVYEYYCEGRLRICLHRERNKQPAIVWGRRTPPPTLRTRSTITSSTGKMDAVNPAVVGTKASPVYRRTIDSWRDLYHSSATY